MKQDWKKQITSALLVAVGNAILAFSVTYFYEPNGFMLGGATGVALIMHHLFGINTSFLVFILNMVLLAIGWIVLGRDFVVSTVFGSLVYPLFLQIFEMLPPMVLTQDKALAMVCGAVLIAVAVSVSMRSGASTGGSDVLGLVANKLFRLPVTAVMVGYDATVLTAAFFLTDPENVLYSLVALGIQMMVMNKFLIAGKSQIQLLIVSKHWQEIRQMILTDMDAGATLVHIETGYEQKEENAVLCVVPQKKLYALQDKLYEIDKSAFLTISEVKEVRGRGFTMSRLRDNME